MVTEPYIHLVLMSYQIALKELISKDTRQSDISQKNQIVGIRQIKALSTTQRVTREKKNGKEKDQKKQGDISLSYGRNISGYICISCKDT